MTTKRTQDGAPESQAQPGARSVGVSPMDRIDQGELLAEIGKIDRKSAAKASDPKPPKERAEAPDEDETEDHDPDDTETEDGEDDPPPDEDEEESDDAGKEVEIDPEEQKRLAGIQRQEKRWKERVEKDKAAHAANVAAFERKVAELQPKLKKLEEFETLQKRIRYAPVDVMIAMGLDPETDFEAISQALYVHSKAGAKDPKARAQSVAAMREREKDDRIAQLEKKIEDLAGGLTAKEQATQTEAMVGTFIDRVAKSVADDAPLMKEWLAKKPEKARAFLRKIGDELADKIEGVPDIAEIIEAAEERRREEIEDMGFEAKPTEEKPAAGKRSRSLARAGGGSGGGTRRKSRDEEFEDLRAEVSSGKPLTLS